MKQEEGTGTTRTEGDNEKRIDETQEREVDEGGEEEEEEEDYMSEEFLRKLERESKNPRKDESYAKQRARTIRQQKEKGFIKPLREREKEHLDKGLATKVGTDNKGFAMLAKMGFKEGMTLGKTDSGLAEPLPIVRHQGKLGLGLAEESRKRLASQAEAIQQKATEDDASFRDRMNARFMGARIQADARRSRAACEQLDKAAETEDGVLYWPRKAPSQPVEDGGLQEAEEVVEVDEEKEAFDSLNPEDILKQVTNYLRTRHHYCIWCGTAYESIDEMENNCPGATADDH